jgi:hypothetical protein
MISSSEIRVDFKNRNKRSLGLTLVNKKPRNVFLRKTVRFLSSEGY